MKRLLPVLLIAASVCTVRADYWTYMYLAYNGFMTWDMGKFAQKQAQAMVLGTVADPNSILGKTGGLLDQEMVKLNLNYEEKETLAKIFTAIGDPAAMGNLASGDSSSLGRAVELGDITDQSLENALRKAEELGLDPTQLKAMSAMAHQMARTQAFDYAIREYEKMGGSPMTLNERAAFNSELQLLKNEQLTHQNLTKLAAVAAKASADQKLAESRALGMQVIQSSAMLGQSLNAGVNPESFAPPQRQASFSAGLYDWEPAQLLRRQQQYQAANLGDDFSDPVSGQNFATGNYPANGDLSETAYSMIGVSTRDINGTVNGRLGCAAAVSMMYKNSTGENILPGREMVLGTGELYSGLSNDSRFVKLPLSQAQPGDIVVTAKNGSRSGHTGIVGNGGRIISNSSDGFQGSAPGTIQNNYSVSEWERRVTPRNPNQTAVFRRI